MPDSIDRVPGARLPGAAPAPEARERVVEALTHHFAEGRLSEEDLEDRLARAYGAASTDDLAAVAADLPALTPAADSALAAPAAAKAERISALFSGQEQRLDGPLARRLEVRARLGYVELDLTRASFAPGITEIDVRSFMGYVQIRFPAGLRVENRGRGLFGFFSLKSGPSSDSDPAASIVRITGRASFGFAECFVARNKKALPDGGQ